MITFSISSLNCFNLSVAGEALSYSRLIDNKLYRVIKASDNLLKTISILSELSDDDFKFIAEIAKQNKDVG